MAHKFAIALIALALGACSRDNPPTNNVEVPNSEFRAIHLAMKRVEPFFKTMGKPQKYDWLGSHNEPGETFDQYVARELTKPKSERRRIYVLPLGSFSQKQLGTISLTAGYLDAFYGLPVTVMRQRPMDAPLSTLNSRHGRGSKALQVRTGYLLKDVLKPTLPADGAALIALTNNDLYIDSSTSFVFGEASTEDHVGVWSLYRLGDTSDKSVFLRRTLKIATHEVGHMFSMHHCIKYECVMSGTNYLGETDRRPIDACPECSAKIWWLTDVAPATRYLRLADFCRKNGLATEASEFTQKAEAVKQQ